MIIYKTTDQYLDDYLAETGGACLNYDFVNRFLEQVKDELTSADDTFPVDDLHRVHDEVLAAMEAEDAA